MHCIENEFLKVRAREYGAELTSVYSKQNNIEHLWQADPAFWGWHAPVLFPVVGRCENDEIRIEGKSYRMEKHGFARKSQFKLLELGDSKMIFSLVSTDETLAIYPYHFELLIGYRLTGNQLKCTYEVINKEDKDIYFSLGAHPAFAVPFTAAQGEYEDYYLEFEKEESLVRHYINEDGYFDGRTAQVSSHSRELNLHQGMFDKDAYIFKTLQSGSVKLKSRKSRHFVAVRFEGFEYLGLWAKTGASYVCIEPWIGCADTAGKPTEFAKKEGVIPLQSKQEFSRTIVLEVGEW